MKILHEFCQGNQIPFKENYYIKYDTYFKKGGNVNIFIQPQTSNQLVAIVKFLKKNNFEYKILGYTSNVLLLDNHDYDVIVSTKAVNDIRFISDEVVEVDAGFSLSEFVRIALLKGITGFEGLEGIPGTVGGAVLMNAGAYGYSISDNLIEVQVIKALFPKSLNYLASL